MKTPLTATEYYNKVIDETNIPREHYEWEIIGLMRDYAEEYASQLYTRQEVEQILERAADNARIKQVITYSKSKEVITIKVKNSTERMSGVVKSISIDRESITKTDISK